MSRRQTAKGIPSRSPSAARWRRRTLADHVGLLFVAGLILLAIALGGGYGYDLVHREVVRPRTVQGWGPARARLVTA